MHVLKVWLPNGMELHYTEGTNGVKEIITAPYDSSIDWAEVRYEGGRTELFSGHPYIFITN